MSPAIIDRGRGPEIAGTRITVFDVWEYAKAGWHHTAIAALFRLSSAQISAAMDYIAAHKAEVLAEYQRIMDRIARGNPPELQARFAASHERLRRFRQQEAQTSSSETRDALPAG